MLLIAFSLSMDAFALSLSYGLLKISKKNMLLTSIMVGTFHFVMPYLGNMFGNILFEYVYISPKTLIFLVFLLISISMFISFFEKEKEKRKLNLIGILLFAISVSLDSFSVGLTLNYITNNLYLSCFIFSLVSLIMTLTGFAIGKYVGRIFGKYSYFLGASLLFIYSLWVLTN